MYVCSHKVLALTPCPSTHSAPSWARLEMHPSPSATGMVGPVPLECPMGTRSGRWEQGTLGGVWGGDLSRVPPA